MRILTKRLNGLISDSRELAEYLGCSIQAINQFKNGASFPKCDNLVKIALFYGVSIDYLFGLTDSRKPYLSISEYTGLSEKAIESIKKLDKKSIEGLNSLLEGIANI